MTITLRSKLKKLPVARRNKVKKRVKELIAEKIVSRCYEHISGNIKIVILFSNNTTEILAPEDGIIYGTNFVTVVHEDSSTESYPNCRITSILRQPLKKSL